MGLFKTCQHFLDWLTKRQTFEFVSEPECLEMQDMQLLALATQDFNPHCCRPAFAKTSFFGNIVSHGIGIIARAEGWFVPFLQNCFEGPVEIGALGYDRIRYLSPLRLGEKYRYRFRITKACRRKNRIDLACHFTCEVLGPHARVVAEADWMPSLIQHPSTKLTEKYLRPRSYARNIVEVIVPPFIKTCTQALLAYSCAGMFIWIFVLVLLGALGMYHSPAMDMMSEAPPL